MELSVTNDQETTKFTINGAIDEKGAEKEPLTLLIRMVPCAVPLPQSPASTMGVRLTTAVAPLICPLMVSPASMGTTP